MLKTRGARNAKRAAACLGVLTLALIGAGCQSKDSAADAEGHGTVDQAAVDRAQANVKAASATVTSGVPTSSPATLTNKSVVLIPCAQAGEGCAQPAEGAKEAAEALGWKVTVIDGKGSADSQSAAILQAISLKADGIITFAIDPSTVKGAITQARKAGIKVLASSSPPSNLVDFADNPTKATWKKAGALGADYIISKTQGRAQVALLTDTEFAAVTTRTTAFADEIGTCSSCKLITTKNFNYADTATSLPQTVQQLVQSTPNLNAIYVPYDAAVPAVLQGLKAVGAKDILVVSGDGTSQALACLQTACGQAATVAFPLSWIGWSDIDALNRLLQGQDAAPAAKSVPVKLLTSENVGDSKGTWSGDMDFRAGYKKLWGIG